MSFSSNDCNSIAALKSDWIPLPLAECDQKNDSNFIGLDLNAVTAHLPSSNWQWRMKSGHEEDAIDDHRWRRWCWPDWKCSAACSSVRNRPYFENCKYHFKIISGASIEHDPLEPVQAFNSFWKPNEIDNQIEKKQLKRLDFRWFFLQDGFKAAGGRAEPVDSFYNCLEF